MTTPCAHLPPPTPLEVSCTPSDLLHLLLFPSRENKTVDQDSALTSSPEHASVTHSLPPKIPNHQGSTYSLIFLPWPCMRLPGCHGAFFLFPVLVSGLSMASVKRWGTQAEQAPQNWVGCVSSSIWAMLCTSAQILDELLHL